MPDLLPPSLTFSQEEVALLLKVFNAPTIPGLGENPMAGLSEDEARLVLSSAERSLKARQLLSTDPGGKLDIEKLVLALLGPCISPELTVIATRTLRRNIPISRYFHRAQAMNIEHAISGPGLHNFAALQSIDTLLDHLAGFLHLSGQSALEVPAGEIPVQALQMALQNFDAGETALLAAMQVAGLPEVFWQGFGRDLGALIAVSAVVVIHHAPIGEAAFSQFAFLETAHTLWQMRSDTFQPDSAHIQLQSISAEQARQQLQSLLG